MSIVHKAVVISDRCDRQYIDVLGASGIVDITV